MIDRSINESLLLNLYVLYRGNIGHETNTRAPQSLNPIPTKSQAIKLLI